MGLTEVDPPPKEGDPNGTRYVLVDGRLVKERRSAPTPLRQVFVAVILGLLVLVAALSILAAFERAVESQERADDAERQALIAEAQAESLRLSVIEGCRSDNEIRRAVRSEWRQQNAQTARLPHEAFPGISEEEFEALKLDAIDRRKIAIERMASVDCDDRYARIEELGPPPAVPGG